ncbi:hypothetical protein ABZU25_16265 [Micromonospora sp. NPDC005215]|uniref:hypothetical protein n=1 Tax=Micromonospora sp. NPDC005215 TaxID=3157024 RepID=UPI0033A480F3
MGESAEPVGEVLVLGRSRVWPAVAVPVAVVIGLIVGAVLFDWVGWGGLVLSAGSIVLAFVHWRNAVLADDTGLLVRDRGGLRRSYAWSEIERMGWQDAGMWGSSLVVYPRGGPYDVPGPNASVNVARIWRPRRAHLADPMPALLRTHGIKTISEP